MEYNKNDDYIFNFIIYLNKISNYRKQVSIQRCTTTGHLLAQYGCDRPLGEYWDFIYIDALHTYEGVKNDIQNYKGLLIPGGFLAGHDYGWDGVKQAVDENVIVHETFKDTSWISKL